MNSAFRPEGVYVAMLTPMTPDERVNLPGLGHQIARMRESGIDAAFVLGTNGEFYALTYEEKAEVMHAAREAAPPGMIVCAGVGCVTTAETVRLAREAEASGVDAIAVITPYFAALDQEQIHRHFAAVSDAVSLPVILYNIPSRAGNVIAPETAASLCSVANVVGIKDSSGSIESLDAFIEAAGENAGVLVGSDGLVFEGLARGAAGCVSGMANLTPELLMRIYCGWADGRIDDALAAEEELNMVRRILSHGNSNSVVKLAARLVGEPVGPCRMPAEISDPGVIGRVKTILEECGLLTEAYR